MPNLTENFDQLKMSSEIRSSDHSPKKYLFCFEFPYNNTILIFFCPNAISSRK